jgi:hypothetical protein
MRKKASESNSNSGRGVEGAGEQAAESRGYLEKDISILYIRGLSLLIPKAIASKTRPSRKMQRYQEYAKSFLKVAGAVLAIDKQQWSGRRSEVLTGVN